VGVPTAVVVVVFFAVAVVVADKFSADAEVLPYVVGAPGVETDGGGVLHC